MLLSGLVLLVTFCCYFTCTVYTIRPVYFTFTLYTIRRVYFTFTLYDEYTFQTDKASCKLQVNSIDFRFFARKRSIILKDASQKNQLWSSRCPLELMDMVRNFYSLFNCNSNYLIDYSFLRMRPLCVCQAPNKHPH